MLRLLPLLAAVALPPAARLTVTVAPTPQKYDCYNSTDAAGGHDIELPWVSSIQNETACRAACDSLSNCSAYVAANETCSGDGQCRFTCGGCWLKADPQPTTDPLGPEDPFGQAGCRRFCGKAHLPLYSCGAAGQCVLDDAGARVRCAFSLFPHHFLLVSVRF